MNSSRIPILFTTLLLGASAACAEAEDSALSFPSAGDETSEDSASEASGHGHGGGADDGINDGGADGAGTTGVDSDSGGDEGSSTRITAIWTESEGTYLRALPGEALAMQLPQVAQVAAFLPSAAQALEDDSAYISLLDEQGEPLLATRLRSVSTHPDGLVVESGAQLSYFSSWGLDFPIGFCVTEPCFMYPWDEAPKATQFIEGTHRWFDGEVAGQRFYAHYLDQGGEATVVEEKGFEYIGASDLSDLKRAQAAVNDLAELSVQVSEHPQASVDADPCELLENAAQGAAAAGGAACCAETGGFGCFFCFAAAQSLVEWLEQWC